MEQVEAEGNTIDEAIANALNMLGVERDKVTVDILAEGKRGILGFWARKARVRASLRKSLFVEKEPEEEERPGEEQKFSAEEIAAVGRKGGEGPGENLRAMGINATPKGKPGGGGAF